MKKQVAIYGYGKSAKSVAEYILDQFSKEINIVGFYVLDLRATELDNIDEFTVYNIEAIKEMYITGVVNSVIIPNLGKQVVNVLERHYELQMSEILYVSAQRLRRPINERYFIEINSEKPWLDGFEFHVADHCNLNCKGCGHCANLFQKPSYPDIYEYEKDLKRLKQLYDGIGLIRLLGGEPLLNNQLDKFIKVTKLYFEETELHIVTNGILLTKMSESLIKIIKEEQVIIDVSLYPPVEERLPDFVVFLEKHRIEYNIMPVELFYKRFSVHGKYDKMQAFMHCGTATCHALYKGKLSSCIVPFSVEQLNRRFGTEIDIDGWIDIYDENITGWKINWKLQSPFELCTHCNPQKQLYPWTQRKYKDCVLQDWLLDEGSEDIYEMEV